MGFALLYIYFPVVHIRDYKAGVSYYIISPKNQPSIFPDNDEAVG